MTPQPTLGRRGIVAQGECGSVRRRFARMSDGMSEQKQETAQRVDISAKFDPRVDLSLLRSNLQRSYAERLQYAVSASNALRKMREHARRNK